MPGVLFEVAESREQGGMSRDITQMQEALGLLRLGYAQPLLELPARRWQEGETTERMETVAEEIPVAMVYNGIPHAVMMATPQDLEDFALGFSLTEELIGSKADDCTGSSASGTAEGSRSR